MYNSDNQKPSFKKKKPSMASEMMQAAMPDNSGGSEQKFKANGEGIMVGSNPMNKPFKSSESQTMNLNDYMEANKLRTKPQRKPNILGN